MMKYWNPGDVKTRLGSSIGYQQAAHLHRTFVGHLCQQLAKTAGLRELVVWPPEQIPLVSQQLAQWQSESWNIRVQVDGDLGQRMARWIEDTLAHCEVAILIGADCPVLSHDDISTAISMLQANDVVLGPAADGGYYLVGIRGPWKDQMNRLFENMTWSQGDVFQTTERRITEIGLKMGQLPIREDIDTNAELSRLRNELTISDNPTDRTLSRQIDLILNTDAEDNTISSLPIASE
ncbi:2-phospho-L-lactate guanylyltransferase [Rubripirellula amarantea]|uniref:2-phospho-L-lactate guanylyltransferase n=2 Tax=Rubripirellula amarantea TaxID=2527999 RepID=A0A5C5WSK6_9BACT|nr:2-phospho-L-lactate guanylyltransferase [Rubripirellula amarantea]